MFVLFVGLAPASVFANPIIAGDYPDPSIIHDKNGYWAVATSSEWGPHFPILHSRDLKTWEHNGAVFPSRPDWVERNFWAPEFFHHNGKYFVYYTARKKDGPLCVAVATADQPEGPYTDHGSLVCQEAGSIDALPFFDNGQLWLFWKEDGNSRGLPTPIWAQRLSVDGLRLEGEKQEVFTNDPATWEGNLIEGQFIVKREDYFYMFYAGNACCGRNCNYGSGVARSKNLLGPYERNPANPILVANDTWKCPGHGSIVKDESGRDMFMYHAYSTKDFVYVGRQAMLDEVKWGEDGWPTISDGTPGVGPSTSVAVYDYDTSFTNTQTATTHGWQWPQSNPPTTLLGPQGLLLTSSAQPTTDPLAATWARSTVTGNYTVTAEVDPSSVDTGTSAGIALIGTPLNAIGVSYGDGALSVWEIRKGEMITTLVRDFPTSRSMHLMMNVREGHLINFAASIDDKTWQQLIETRNGEYLPAWDRGLRVGLVTNKKARFLRFSMKADERSP